MISDKDAERFGEVPIDTISTGKKHEYPDLYKPTGKDTDNDRAWELLDRIKPGIIPYEIRCFLAGGIVGLQMKARSEERDAHKRATG